LAFSFWYSICLIVFFTSVIHITREKRFLLLVLAIILFQLLFWSLRVWTRRIKLSKEKFRSLLHLDVLIHRRISWVRSSLVIYEKVFISFN
jgi:hypothetical protein